ncbi:MAG: hypothetical protein JOZ99_06320 [Actinobacteria bacterium]|nr:hypothetical protein [Actinomycetota bacterium]
MTRTGLFGQSGPPDFSSGTRAAVLRVTRPLALTSFWAPVIAASGVAMVWAFGFRGPDVPAQMYLSQLFHSHGWVLWNNAWYGGHYGFSYSVLFPALGSMIGLYGAALVCAVASAWAFERLMVAHFGRAGTLAVVLFAAGTIVPAAIGQLPFLAGEAAGLLALVAAHRDHRILAVALAASCGLFSEVAGVFLVLALVAWGLTSDPAGRRRIFMLAGVAALPVAVLSLTLPRLGPFPFRGPDLALVVAFCAVGALAVPSRHRALRIGLVLYGIAAIVVFVVPNPLGGNVGRLAAYFAPPLLAVLATVPGRRVLAVFVLPLLLWQWVPSVSSISAATGSDPSVSRSYYTPLVDYLTHQGVIGRVEIPFTRSHWEAAYVAPSVPLARGWVRQLDTLDNPLFYGDSLTSSQYHDWLVTNGVTWVALADVPLDYSAMAEARVLKAGQSYLQPVWHDAHWRVWKVTDSPGLVSGPATVTSLQANRVTLDATAPGTVLLRIRYTSLWTVKSGSACVATTNDGWTRVVVAHPGPVELTTSLLHTATDCDVPAAPSG